MKAFYENPEMQIVEFEVEDIITTSSTEVSKDLNDIFGGDNTEPGWGDIV